MIPWISEYHSIVYTQRAASSSYNTIAWVQVNAAFLLLPCHNFPIPPDHSTNVNAMYSL